MSGSYRDLDVYRSSHALAVHLHRFSLLLPKYEMYETGSQLRRASKAISANIVEGYGRRYKGDFVRFLVYAHSSCDETVEWIHYVKDCHEPLASKADEWLQAIEDLGRKLNRFIQAVESGHRT